MLYMQFADIHYSLLLLTPTIIISEVTCYQVLLLVNKHFTTLPYINIITLDPSQMRDKLSLLSFPSLPYIITFPLSLHFRPLTLTLFQCSPFPSLLSSAVSFQTWLEVESYPKWIWCTANIKNSPLCGTLDNFLWTETAPFTKFRLGSGIYFSKSYNWAIISLQWTPAVWDEQNIEKTPTFEKVEDCSQSP